MTNRSRKVLFVSNELQNFRHHREHLIRAVVEAGGKPMLIATENGSTKGLSYDFHAIPIARFQFHPLLDFRLFISVLYQLLVVRPSAIHLITIKPYLFGGLAARLAHLFGWRGQTVITVPGLGRLYDRNDDFFLADARRVIVERLLRIATKHAKVTFETTKDRDFWISRKLITFNQTTVTRGTGINLQCFTPRSRGPTNGRLNVLFAGRLLKAKGLDVFLKAASLLNNLDIDMNVAGFDERDPDAVSSTQLRYAKGIKLLGAVDDMPGLLAQTDIVVLPSRYNEGLPRILLEGAAAGCIIIATRFSGSEILIEHGKTGLFLDAGNVNSQAGRLATLLAEIKINRDKYERIGREASLHVRNRGFSDHEVARVFLGLYAMA